MTRRFSTKPPREYVFFTDRDLGNIIPDALAKAGARVERHDAHFPPTARDTDWLPVVGERGWLVLTHNKRQRYVALERDMAMRSGVALFILIGKLTHAEIATNLVKTLPAIIAFRDKHDPPFIAKVYRPDPDTQKPGRVELALSLPEWQKSQKSEGEQRRGRR